MRDSADEDRLLASAQRQLDAKREALGLPLRGFVSLRDALPDALRLLEAQFPTEASLTEVEQDEAPF